MNDQIKAYAMTIGGKSVATSEHKDIMNPATGAVVGRMPMGTRADLDAAVAAARAAFPGWAATPDATRKELCHAVAAKIEEHSEEIAALITAEQGKPLNGLGSRFEMGGCVGWAHSTADLDLPVETIQDNDEGKIELHRKPVGVVASITPWNWPVLIAVWHVLPAIRAGNTVVIKPSPYTPLSTLRLVEVMNEVLPAGVMNAVSGADDLGAAMSEHEGIDKIVFTGSIATGKKVMGSAAGTLKRLTLELGGNDAGIVLPDADPAAIAEGLFWGAFINTGQTCAALKRLYVHEDVYDDVVQELAAIAGAMPMGPGTDEQNVLGPLTTEQQFGVVDRLVEDAKARGGRVVLGGDPDRDAAGWFYPATLIDGLDDDADLVREEQFGPALPILKYADVDDAIERANRGDAGLGASVWSSDPERAREVAARIQAGSVWINSHGTIHPMAPFGGVKGSGYGLEFGVEGLKAMGVPQVIHG